MSSGGQLRERAYEKEGPSEIEAKEKTEKWNNEQKNIFNILTKNDTPFSFLSILRNFMILVWLFEIERDITNAQIGDYKKETNQKK